MPSFPPPKYLVIAAFTGLLFAWMHADAAVIWRDDFVDDPQGTVPQLRTGTGIPGDVDDVGISWIDLGADNLATVDTSALSLTGSNGGGMDSGIRGTFSTVEINEVFVFSFDVSFGSGQIGTHLGIGNSLSEDVGNNLITGGMGFFGIRLIKGGDIERWNSGAWTAVGTVADFAGQTATITLNELSFNISVGASEFNNLAYAAPRTQLSQMELAFAGNNGSRSTTGLITGENLGVIPEPSVAILSSLGCLALLCRRRRCHESQNGQPIDANTL